MKKKHMICKVIHAEEIRFSRKNVGAPGDDGSGYYTERSNAESWILINGKGLSEDLTIVEVYTKG